METEKCKTDKAIFKALIRQCTKNMKETGDYISCTLTFLEKQPLPEMKKAEIRVRLVHAIKDMIGQNEALSLISWKDKKLLGEFCMLLLDEAECHLVRTNDKFENKKRLINEMLEFYACMHNLHYFDSIFYKDKWHKKSTEKICHYERLLGNT